MGGIVDGRIAMSSYELDLLDRPSVGGGMCAVCGRPASNRHHVIMKGAGGRPRALERRIPTIPLCGMGNAGGCHGLAHAHRLHFRWRGGWEFLITDEPVKYGGALAMGGWRPLEGGAE